MSNAPDRFQNGSALLAYLFDGRPNLLLEPMAHWLGASRRFAAFAATFRDKIRKKIRTTPDESTLLDLRLELEAAFLLLQDRKLSLEYEPELSKGVRGPDFAVSFTTRMAFMLEVTRLQGGPGSTPAAGLHLADAVLDKLGQLLPSRANILLVGLEAAALAPADLREALVTLQQRAERNDSGFLQRNGFHDRGDFFRHFQRLSEVLVRMPQSISARPLTSWINPYAKGPLPGRVRTVLHRSLGAATDGP
jgi:hypothetical protein